MTLDDYIINGIKKDEIFLFDPFAGVGTTIVDNKIVELEDKSEEWFDLNKVELELDFENMIARVVDKATRKYVEGNNDNPFYFEIKIRNTAR